MATLDKITPNLWFSDNAEEAANFYLTVFKNASIGTISHYGKVGYEIHKMPEGTVMTIEFTLEGQKFIGLNGGPVFKFSEAISFVINCETQQEIDYYWEKLSEGGDASAQQCGWLKDKFGLSWQVVPVQLAEIMSGENEKAGRAMAAMLKMKKLILKDLVEA
jgi:predicted 3-demethylubiquinone-9 3-methyltransferase (glyoxalase superfamily)